MSLRQGANTLLNVTERFDGAQTLEELASIFKNIMSGLGGFYLAAGLFSPHSEPQKNVLTIDYPTYWATHYFDNGYIDIDPTIHMKGKALRPFEWNSLQGLSKRQDRMFKEVADIGVLSGLTVPIHLPDKSTFIASFAALDKQLPELRPFLIFVAGAFYEKYVVLSRIEHQSPITLSPRERECLTWAAFGKSSWDIGTILNISENTVNFHLKNAFSKLGGKGRILCVVKAIMLGLISP